MLNKLTLLFDNFSISKFLSLSISLLSYVSKMKMKIANSQQVYFILFWFLYLCFILVSIPRRCLKYSNLEWLFFGIKFEIQWEICLEWEQKPRAEFKRVKQSRVSAGMQAAERRHNGKFTYWMRMSTKKQFRWDQRIKKSTTSIRNECTEFWQQYTMATFRFSVCFISFWRIFLSFFHWQCQFST